MLAGRRYLRLPVVVHWAFRNRADARSKIAAVPQRVKLYAEYRTRSETARRNALLCNGSRACHFNAPGDWFTVAAAHRPAIRPERNEMELRVIGLSYEPRGNSRPHDCLALVVHRERVVRDCRSDENGHGDDCSHCGDRTLSSHYYSPHYAYYFFPSSRSIKSRTFAGRSSSGLSQPF